MYAYVQNDSKLECNFKCCTATIISGYTNDNKYMSVVTWQLQYLKKVLAKSKLKHAKRSNRDLL